MLETWKAGYANNAREALDLASRHVRRTLAERLFPGKSRVYQRVELSRIFSNGDDSRRCPLEAIDFICAHGDALVLAEYVLRAGGHAAELAALKEQLAQRSRQRPRSESAPRDVCPQRTQGSRGASSEGSRFGAVAVPDL